MTNDTICVSGSHGELYADASTGYVLSYSGCDCDECSDGGAYGIVVRVNLDELRRLTGDCDLDGVDILDVGYWYNEGTAWQLGYEPTRYPERRAMWAQWEAEDAAS